MQISAVRRWAVVTATAAVAALSFATPAQARADVFHFDGQNNATRRCMDDSFAYGLRAFGCNGTDFQQFRFGDGTYYHELRNKVTGRCIDDSFAYGLRAFTCNSQSYQQWSVSNTTGGTTFRNRATGRCIDDSLAYGLRAFDCNGMNYQKWWGVHAN
ncbi:RICIN domain-containing protein [Streptomyces bambusae]|uniref:RICIN domain-containing protein n=1 Tax=Streptomyces bambusae TaxID=1550616 RepID=UPI001CFC6A25|nr:RICIN domain-containing protein [Streptomyces bambusae]MCB5164725.1 RICIN domain-containing protein [Streptomyces bambusae]